ncbi:phage shock protein PspC (stress-responsive transcriptional regulator) [Plantactinospora soyae]|uniref:Phage shock protein PspC (Stress-responsive transcriptional regulator) n=1 Tax=Plantactinospora soyae TaxID=1544732 RepID=A0A927R309_9ACTN|nr:phage shock protein PspC (stress-responsive transcriptional regulator) [Plantactinospora soyae]
MTQIPLHQPPYKQLRRPTTDRMIAGVASGLGRYFNVDPTLVRVIFAGIAVLTGGLGLLAYPVMWFLMPEEPANAPAWPHPAPQAGPVWPPNWPTGGARGPTDAPTWPTHPVGTPVPPADAPTAWPAGTPSSSAPPVPPAGTPSMPPSSTPPVPPTAP